MDIDNKDDTLKKINEKKAFLAERARRNYQKRKEEGRQPIKKIPEEQKKKVGRKPKEQQEDKGPKPKGRKPAIIESIETAPEYIKKLLKDKPLEQLKSR
jgi:hypothetical protein